MSELGHHAEWLSLIEISGPFLAEPVLKDAFPQGLEGLDSAKKTTVRQAYDEWREALDLDDPDLPRIHRAWIDLILNNILELDEVLKPVDKLPDTVRCELPEHGLTLRPDYAVMDPRADTSPLILIAVYGSETSLTDTLKDDGWPASPAERMVELCRATNVRLGLVSNGERWMLVDAPVGAVTTFASWYARLWGQEPVTLQAFINLLGVRRFFVDRSEQLPALLDDSLKFQDEVTDALGEQVRRAVEVLIQALDRADVDRKRELLDGIEPAELYEAGLTVMMRIVFLLSAEERGLLLLGDQRYEANYAVSTLRMQLRGESEEILEGREDAWARLLAIFRAVYGGVTHEAMRLPALGGSLFNPDRFPFLEGRRKASRWKIDPATPLPIDNRTVLYLLDAVQIFQGRTLSYLALDIEQIGYVYEGLLERTVVRANEVTLDLDATKNAKNPWVSLPELDDAAAKGCRAVEELLKERTASSPSRVRNDLAKTVDDSSADKLLTACHADRSLRDRIRPYFHFLRTDRWGYPIVYPKGAFMVTSGEDRRETGTHYTPKSFTEAIIKATLEPLVYAGAAEDKSREEWVLKSSTELLDLKICDPAMGSGAFLVQVCRWLSERLVEAWVETEKQGKAITSQGEIVEAIGSQEPMRNNAEERLLTARRLIAERCLYGVDVNPLAVELAKLSIWLVTLAKGRPFGFLDHNLRSGDSLLGIQSLEQLHYLDMKPGKGSAKKLFASKMDQAVEQATVLRSDLRNRPIQDIRDVEAMAGLDGQARGVLRLPEVIADAFVGEVLAASGNHVDTTALSIEAGAAMEGDEAAVEALAHRAHRNLSAGLSNGRLPRRPLHWPLEFPEVFGLESDGFDAIVSNPPFLGGRNITAAIGKPYNDAISYIYDSPGTSSDLCSYFLRRGYQLLREDGQWGSIAVETISSGKTKENGLQRIVQNGGQIRRAFTSVQWPGDPNRKVAIVFVAKSQGHLSYLNGRAVEGISPELTESASFDWIVRKLQHNIKKCFQGITVNGNEFIIPQAQYDKYLSQSLSYGSILSPYLTGDDLNSQLIPKPRDWVINFHGLTEDQAKQYGDVYDFLRDNIREKRQEITSRRDVKEKWWSLQRVAPDMELAISGIDRVICRTRYGSFHALTFSNKGAIFSDGVIVFAFSDYATFSLLQSDIHFAWALKYGSPRGGALRYKIKTCFETFPFPKSMSTLQTIGEEYFRCRQSVMESAGRGLTHVYNRLHDETDDGEDIIRLRKSHVKINESVLKSYEWDDIDLKYQFRGLPELLNGKVLFTISADARDEILLRLLKLNKLRYEEESSVQDKEWSNATRTKQQVAPHATDLFPVEEGLQ